MKKILLIENDPVIKNNIEIYFRLNSYKVFVQEKVCNVIPDFNVIKPDIVIIGLPNKCNKSTNNCKIITTINQHKKPLIVLSDGHHADCEELLNSVKQKKIINKPFQLLNLLETVENLLKTNKINPE